MLDSESIKGPGAGSIIIPTDPGLDLGVARYVVVEIWAGGGGGSSESIPAGEGGGGGGYVYYFIEIPNGPAVVEYNIGAAGGGAKVQNTSGTGAKQASATIIGVTGIAGGGQPDGVAGLPILIPPIINFVIESGGAVGGYGIIPAFPNTVSIGDNTASAAGGGGSSALPVIFTFTDDGVPIASKSPSNGFNSGPTSGGGVLEEIMSNPGIFGTGGAGGGIGNPNLSLNNIDTLIPALSGNDGTTPGGGGGTGGILLARGVFGLGLNTPIGTIGFGGDGGQGVVRVSWWTHKGRRRRNPKNQPEKAPEVQIPIPKQEPNPILQGINLADAFLTTVFIVVIVVATRGAPIKVNVNGVGGGLLPPCFNGGGGA